MTLSLITCDLGAVFELIGATSACAVRIPHSAKTYLLKHLPLQLAYILPPLCYIKLSTRSWKTIPAILCVGFGVSNNQAFSVSLKNDHSD